MCTALLQNSFIPLQQVTTVGEFANRIGAVRALLSGEDDETPLIGADGTPSLVTADSNAIAYSRTPQVCLLQGFCALITTQNLLLVSKTYSRLSACSSLSDQVIYSQKQCKNKFVK